MRGKADVRWIAKSRLLLERANNAHIERRNYFPAFTRLNLTLFPSASRVAM
jgi:hypothetical protein